MNLDGKNVLLTGASAGIGVYMARELAGRGANLVLAARSLDRLNEVAASLASKRVQAVVVQVDLSSVDDRTKLIQTTLRDAARIDILINNAGLESVGPYEHQSWESIRQMLEVNLAAPMHLTQLVLPHMAHRGSGHIVNISSIGGKSGAPYDAVYCGTKAGIAEWTRGLRLEYSGTGIHFSTVFPGYVTEVGMFARFGVRPLTTIGSCTPEQVGRAVADAIEKEQVEVIVNSLPLRPALALVELFPRLGDWLMHRLGVVDFQRKKFD